MKDKIFERIAWGIEGLTMHSNGMKKEFYQNKLEHLTAHCEALKGFIREVEENMKNARVDINYFNLNAPCEINSTINETGCRRIYAPVCGCDGLTYSNACEATNNGI